MTPREPSESHKSRLALQKSHTPPKMYLSVYNAAKYKYKIYTLQNFKTVSSKLHVYQIENSSIRGQTNSVDLDEAAHYKPTRQDLNCS